MKFAYLAAFAVLTIQPASQSPAMGENLKGELSSAWSARAARYASELEAAQAQKNAAIQALSAAAEAKAPDAQTKASALSDALFNFGISKGRYGVLGAFRAQFAANPSQAASEIWLQEQVSKLQSMSRQGDDEIKAVSLMKPGQGGVTPDAYMTKYADAVAFNGIVRGAIEETQLLDQNLGTYFRAKTADDVDRRRRRATIFGILAAGLGGAARAATPPPPQFPQSPQTIRCTTYFNSTVCSGQ